VTLRFGGDHHLAGNAGNEVRAFGQELLVDLYMCEERLLADLALVYRFLDDLPELIGMQKQAPPFVFVSPPQFPDKAGLSGWVPLIESGIQLHTLTNHRFATVDIYSCHEIDRARVIQFCVEHFRPAEVDDQLVLRGTHL
jgi:S-adenosylmethionine decarboxylase